MIDLRAWRLKGCKFRSLEKRAEILGQTGHPGEDEFNCCRTVMAAGGGGRGGERFVDVAFNVTLFVYSNVKLRLLDGGEWAGEESFSVLESFRKCSFDAEERRDFTLSSFGVGRGGRHSGSASRNGKGRIG